VVFLNETGITSTPCLTGIGFISDQDTINHFNASYDEDTDMFVSEDPTGLRILFCPVQSYKTNKSLMSDRYMVHEPDGLKIKENLLEYTSGALLHNYEETIVEFYKQLGFKITKHGESFVSMVSSNNRFTLMLSLISEFTPTVIFDTNDIFYTTAYLTNKFLPLRKYQTTDNKKFGNLEYKINGYNCVAVGNQDSYSIENSAPHALPNLNAIFRMRKQFPHIQEHTILEHLS
jgi:hypothetical protein